MIFCTHSYPKLILKLTLALTFLAGSLFAAPYGPDGMPIEWTQPDGTKLSLRVFGDEFYARTETLDGHTVIYNPAKKAYEYADVSADGTRLVTSNKAAKNKAPAGRVKGLKLRSEAVQPIWRERYEKLAPGERANWAKRVQAARERGVAAKGQPGAAPSASGGSGGGASQSSSAAFAPVTGNYVGLTILVQFPDDPATTAADPTNFPTTKANMENFCNQIGYTGGGNTGSVRDYFRAQSLNQTDYTQVVTDIVTLPQPRAYYNWSDYPTNATLRDGGLTGRLVLNDAITVLKNQGFNFSGLTRDGSNRVVATNVLYAGATSGVWPDGLWPHRWVLSPQVNVGTASSPIYIFDYQITNAQTANVPIGTFCHENGHLLLKYPDLYDYGGESNGVGSHCLMGGGNHLNGGKTPCPINGYFKDVSGWSNVVDVTASQFFTDALTTTGNKGYRIRKPGTPTEYFLIENRGTGDPWAQYVPDKGILIWHIDETVNGNDNEQMTATQHYEVSVEQADGFFDLEFKRDNGDSTDLFDSTYPNFNDSTTPDAKWWSGANSGIKITVQSAAGASMNVRFGLPANSVEVISPNGGEAIYLGATQTIGWSANITGNVMIELFKGGVFYSTLSANEANDGSFSWVVSPALPVGNDYTIRISSVNTPAFTDSSNADFSISVNPLNAALDTTNIVWNSGGTAPWFAQTTSIRDGVDAAQSGAIDHDQNSYVETTLAGPGTLTFWWKVSSESGYDYLRFYLDGVEQTGSLAKISGNVNWVQKTVVIPAGNRVAKWDYSKDGSVVAGSDAAWLDEVVYTPDATSEIAVEQPVGTDLVDGVASISFGTVNMGSSSSPLTFTIRNTGTSDLTGLALSKAGTNSGDFTLGSLAVTSLAPGESTTFDVTFTPGLAGSRTGIIRIASNDANENPFDITVTGTGLGPGTLAIAPAGNLSPVGTYGGPFTPASLQYTLSNPGNSSINWTASNTQGWVSLSANSGTLVAGASTTLTVSLTAAANSLAIGSYNDTVSFTNTTNGNGSTTRGVSLTANAFPATLSLGNLLQTYDGAAKPISVTTAPAGLANAVTYAGSTTAPTNAGSYAVVATITDPNYTGTTSGTLLISKADQFITFDALAPVLDNAAPFALGATSTSNLAVSYTSSNTAVATVSGNMLMVVGLGTTTITASQGGNTNYNAAATVQQTLTIVRSNPLAVTGGPYKVLFGQTLSLNGGGSFPSFGETIATYEWDLNNDGTFTDATGATPAAINFATLTGTWGMVAGPNTIRLKVTDSANKTSTVSTTVTLVFTLSWDANGTTAGQTNGAGAWLGGNLWTDGVANQTWASGSNAIFGGANSAGGAVTLASPTAVNALTFNQFTGTYTLGSAGQALTINGGINQTSASSTVTFASPIVLGAPQTWTNNSTGGLNVNAALDNGGNLLTLEGNGVTSISTASSIISGAGGITMNGTGRLVLGASGVPIHTYGGTTTLNAGVTLISNNNLGPGNLTMNGGVVESYWSTNFVRGLGSGNGQVRIIGGVSGFSLNGSTGMSVILGNNAANEAVWGAANEAGNANATGFFNPSTLVLQTSASQSGASINFQNKMDLNASSRTIQVSGGTSGSASATISGIIRTSSGTAGITKTGNGLLNLSAANTYNGVTTISAGPISISNAAALGTTAGNTTIAANGSANGAQLRLSNNINVAENIVITGTTEANSYVPAISNTSGSNTLSGGITLNGSGILRLGAGGGTLTFSGNISQTTTAHGIIFIAANGAAIIVNNAIANNGGPLDVFNTTQTTGTGTVTLSGVSGTGLGNATIWQTGILKLGVTNALNTSANLSLGVATTTAGFDVGTFDLAGFNQTINALIGNRNTSNAAADSARRITNSAVGTGTNTLTVGNGNGSGIFNGVIADGATAKIALTKIGSGTQTLAGASTYTGATTISGGTLALGANDALPGTSPVNIGSATLNAATFTDTVGTLDVTSNATINLGTGAALAFADSSAVDWTGGTLNITGTFVPGSSLRFGTTSAGLTPAQLAKISAAGFSGFTLNANGFLIIDNTAPTLISIVDDKAGGQIAVNTLVTYAVTFSEDMDATSVSAADFGNAGSAAISIGTISEIAPGVFTVQVTPTGNGSLQLRINAGAVLRDLAGNPLNTVGGILDDTTLTVQGSYSGWSGGAAFNADANGDGVSNGLAWVMGAADTSTNAGNLMPVFDSTTDANYVIYTYRRSDAANADANTTIAVEYTSSIGAWTTAVHDGSNIIITTTNDFYGASPGVDKVEVKIKRTLIVAGQLFTRMKVTLAP